MTASERIRHARSGAQWASQDERDEQFRATTFDAEEMKYLECFGFVYRAEDRPRDEDGYEHVELTCIYPDGTTHVQAFDHPDAIADASSFIGAHEESVAYTLEERLGAFGLEWEREQAERQGWS